MTQEQAKKMAEKIEALAQRIYDLRDEWPAQDQGTWGLLDRVATKLSKIAGKVKEEGE